MTTLTKVDLTLIWVATRGIADMKRVFNIYAVSWGGTRKLVATRDTFDEAIEFCEEYEWTWLDPVNPYGYEWDLTIDEEEEDE